MLTAILDRLGAAHHRPFSRAWYPRPFVRKDDPARSWPQEQRFRL